jgi:hypothetical protein
MLLCFFQGKRWVCFWAYECVLLPTDVIFGLQDLSDPFVFMLICL